MKERIKDLTGIKSKDILKEVTKAVQTKDLESQVSVSTEHAKVILRIQGNALFLPGKADLQKEARPILDGLIKTTKDYPDYKINIQGHTDDVPVASPMFPTNWELSAARATAVLRYFLDKGIEPTRLTATGFADIFPLVSNDTEAGRAQNRRVELVLEKEK
jgi:chemotaxis protein MotB